MCQHCGKIDDTVKWTENPFILDVWHETVMEWICYDCYGDLVENV